MTDMLRSIEEMTSMQQTMQRRIEELTSLEQTAGFDIEDEKFAELVESVAQQLTIDFQAKSAEQSSSKPADEDSIGPSNCAAADSLRTPRCQGDVLEEPECVARQVTFDSEVSMDDSSYCRVVSDDSSLIAENVTTADAQVTAAEIKAIEAIGPKKLAPLVPSLNMDRVRRLDDAPLSYIFNNVDVRPGTQKNQVDASTSTSLKINKAIHFDISDTSGGQETIREVEPADDKIDAGSSLLYPIIAKYEEPLDDASSMPDSEAGRRENADAQFVWNKFAESGESCDTDVQDSPRPLSDREARGGSFIVAAMESLGLS